MSVSAVFSFSWHDPTAKLVLISRYYRLATGQELNIEQEREPINEDIGELMLVRLLFGFIIVGFIPRSYNFCFDYYALVWKKYS